MMLKIWSVLPDMYIIIAFMGSALAGAKASSHDFFSFSWSVSARVGVLRGVILDEVADRWRIVQIVEEALGRELTHTLPELASV